MPTSEGTSTDVLTITEYAALPAADGLRHELSRGRLVSEPRPGRPHGTAVALLAHHLTAYALERGGVVTTGTGFVLREDPATVRGPDVAYMGSDPEPYGTPEASSAAHRRRSRWLRRRTARPTSRRKCCSTSTPVAGWCGR